MKRLLIMILISNWLNLCGQTINIPLLISGRVFDSKADTIPQNQLHFLVYLKKNPDDFLTEKSLSCGYKTPLWYAELGNINSEWKFGDLLILEFEDSEKLEKKKFQWVIDKRGELPAIFLEPVTGNAVITGFSLSDYGVLQGRPLFFEYSSTFSKTSGIRLNIYDPTGNLVYFSDKPVQISANNFRFTWDGKTTNHSFLRSGVYFYFLSFKQSVVHSGMVSLKND